MHGHEADPTTDPHASRPFEAVKRAPWSILALLGIAQFMVILDVTVVNVALPSIGTDLGFAAGDLQWVVTIYVLFTGGLLLAGGRMADLLGRRQIFIAGLLTFTAASLASGSVSSPEALIASRAAQGIGAAMLSPAALAIITATYEGVQRTKALSAWGAIGAGGAAAGVLLGGILTSAFGWQAIFLVNVPIGLVAAVLALRTVPASPAQVKSLRELDLPGAVAAVAGLGLLVYAIEGADRNGWGSAQTLGLGAGAAVLLLAFALIERRSGHALVPPATWSNRSLVASATVMLGATGLLVGGFFLNSLFLQGELGMSALETGLAFLPLVLVVGVAAHLGPRLLVRFGAGAVIATGLVLAAAGELLLSFASADAGYVANLMPGFVVLGFGVGLVFVGASVTAMSEIDHGEAGLASGLMTTAHEIGAAFGVAILSSVALGGALGGGAISAESYADGALAAAIGAGALAAFAAAIIPAYRPRGDQHAAMH